MKYEIIVINLIVQLYVSWNDLYVWTDNYYLAKLNTTVNDYIKVHNLADCGNIKDNCVIVRYNSWLRCTVMKAF